MWSKLLTAVLTTVAGKIMAAFGLSFVTYVGANELQQQLLSYVTNQIGGISDDALQILYITGMGVCLNWIFGTFAFIASLNRLPNSPQLCQKNKTDN